MMYQPKNILSFSRLSSELTLFMQRLSCHKPLLKIRIANAICWNFLGLFRATTAQIVVFQDRKLKFSAAWKSISWNFNSIIQPNANCLNELNLQICTHSYGSKRILENSMNSQRRRSLKKNWIEPGAWTMHVYQSDLSIWVWRSWNKRRQFFTHSWWYFDDMTLVEFDFSKVKAQF